MPSLEEESETTSSVEGSVEAAREPEAPSPFVDGPPFRRSASRIATSASTIASTSSPRSVHSRPFAPDAKLCAGTAFTVTGTEEEEVWEVPSASVTVTWAVNVPVPVGTQVTVAALIEAHPVGSPLQL